MTLKEKTIKGLFWAGASQGGKQLCQFIITVILARLLSPDDFGLLAMAMVFVNFVAIFSEMGISSALIQKQDAHDRHFYSAFWLNVIVGICLTLVFILASPLIAMFYKKPAIQPILIVISLNFFISSFVVIQQTILTKDMDFKKLAIRDLLAIIVSGIAGIFFAYRGFGVWSLVYQSITFSVVNAILLWCLSPWRPKFMFAKSDIKDIMYFSANITGFNVVNYLARNIDQLLIGKFLGTQALGYYSLAYKIMLYPLQNISGVISRVMFPAFSKIQNDLEKMRTIYLSLIKQISLISFPIMFVLIIIAPEFVNIVYGEKWSPLIVLIRILAICGMFQSIGSTAGIILLSTGKSNLQFKLGLVNTLFVILAVIIGLPWNIYGVAFCYSFYSVLWVLFIFLVVSKLLKLKFGELFQKLKLSYVVSFILMTIIFFIKLFVRKGLINF